MPNRYRLVVAVALCVSLAAMTARAQVQEEADSQIPSKSSPSEETIRFPRRNFDSEDALRRELKNVPELGFDQLAAAKIKKSLDESEIFLPVLSFLGQLPGDLGTKTLEGLANNANRPDAARLPWRTGDDSRLSENSAKWLDANSGELRSCLQGAAGSTAENSTAKVKQAAIIAQLNANWQIWESPDCVPALTQILQAEGPLVRTWLVERLELIKGKEASEALAQRAIFDLTPEVRRKAVGALAARPRNEYKHILLQGLRWPWKAVNDHAAETIAALQLKELSPKLTAMLREPDATLPYEKTENGEKGIFVKEVVKINHNRNCFLCHPPSFSSQDLVRAEVPSVTELSRPTSVVSKGYGPPAAMSVATPVVVPESSVGIRADITFLRQDFSVVEPVANPGRAPAHQRFDYVVRERPANAKEKLLYESPDEQLKRPNHQREAILFALHSQNWQSYSVQTNVPAVEQSKE